MRIVPRPMVPFVEQEPNLLPYRTKVKLKSVQALDSIKHHGR